MNREDRIKMMVANYTKKRDQFNGGSVMKFHREHLLLFVNRFARFVAHFATPSSSLLSHDMFLLVEAATIVAKSDWEKCKNEDFACHDLFVKYFAAFDELAEGLGPLDRGAALCFEALNHPA